MPSSRRAPPDQIMSQVASGALHDGPNTYLLSMDELDAAATVLAHPISVACSRHGSLKGTNHRRWAGLRALTVLLLHYTTHPELVRCSDLFWVARRP